MANGWISTILDSTKGRLFPNYYDLTIRSGNPSLDSSYSKLDNTCVSITFGGDYSLDNEYNENTKQNFIKSVKLIKTVTLTFYETDKMTAVRAFQEDLDSIYDRENHFFLETAMPNRTISIMLNGSNTISGFTLSDGLDGWIILNESKLQSFSYPKFSWKDGEPVEISATFNFNNMKIVSYPNGNGS